MLLSCHFLYQYLDSDETRWKQARQLGKDISQSHATLRLSPLQAIYEVAHFRDRFERAHGKQNSKDLAEAYRGDIRFADGSEEVSDSFADMAIA
eukprot:14351646-Alexandrium_andersonii.AAC.1